MADSRLVHQKFNRSFMSRLVSHDNMDLDFDLEADLDGRKWDHYNHNLVRGITRMLDSRAYIDSLASLTPRSNPNLAGFADIGMNALSLYPRNYMVKRPDYLYTIVGLMFAYALVSLGTGIISGSTDVLEDQFVNEGPSSQKVKSGLVGCVQTLGNVIASPILSLLIVKAWVTVPFILSAGISIASFCSIMTGVLPPSYSTLLILRFIGGAPSAVFDSLASPIVHHTAPENRRSICMGLTLMSRFGGQCIGCMLGSKVKSWKNFSFLFVLSGCVMIPLVIIFASSRNTFRISSKSYERLPSEEEINTKGLNQATKKPEISILRELTTNRVYVLLTIGTSCAIFTMTAVFFWMPAYIRNIFDEQEGGGVFGFGIMMGTASVMGTIFGAISIESYLNNQKKKHRKTAELLRAVLYLKNEGKTMTDLETSDNNMQQIGKQVHERATSIRLGLDRNANSCNSDHSCDNKGRSSNEDADESFGNKECPENSPIALSTISDAKGTTPIQSNSDIEGIVTDDSTKRGLSYNRVIPKDKPASMPHITTHQLANLRTAVPVSLVFILVALFCFLSGLFIQSFTWFMVFLTPGSFFLFATGAPAQLAIMTSVPLHLRIHALAFSNAFYQLTGAFLAPPVIGVMTDSAGFRGAFLFAFLWLSWFVLTWALVYKEIRPKKVR